MRQHHRAEGAVIRPIIGGSRIVTRMAERQPAPIDDLRPRRCLNPECNAMFALCRSCDRGQRYCSGPCRRRMRRHQLLAAGRRYQASEAGKKAHRHRQCTYRRRQSGPSVTHQGRVSITVSPPTAGACLSRCAVCGQTCAWMNPFYWLPATRCQLGRAGAGRLKSKNLRF
jgi:hypothetical protein